MELKQKTPLPPPLHLLHVVLGGTHLGSDAPKEAAQVDVCLLAVHVAYRMQHGVAKGGSSEVLCILLHGKLQSMLNETMRYSLNNSIVRIYCTWFATSGK